MRVVALTTTHEAEELPTVEFLLPDLVGIEVGGGGGDFLLRLHG
jgi:hypothetical protein